jgi:hypothetical protein
LRAALFGAHSFLHLLSVYKVSEKHWRRKIEKHLN